MARKTGNFHSGLTLDKLAGIGLPGGMDFGKKLKRLESVGFRLSQDGAATAMGGLTDRTIRNWGPTPPAKRGDNGRAVLEGKFKRKLIDQGFRDDEELRVVCQWLFYDVPYPRATQPPPESEERECSGEWLLDRLQQFDKDLREKFVSEGPARSLVPHWEKFANYLRTLDQQKLSSIPSDMVPRAWEYFAAWQIDKFFQKDAYGHFKDIGLDEVQAIERKTHVAEMLLREKLFPQMLKLEQETPPTVEVDPLEEMRARLESITARLACPDLSDNDLDQISLTLEALVNESDERAWHVNHLELNAALSVVQHIQAQIACLEESTAVSVDLLPPEKLTERSANLRMLRKLRADLAVWEKEVADSNERLRSLLVEIREPANALLKSILEGQR